MELFIRFIQLIMDIITQYQNSLQSTTLEESEVDKVGKPTICDCCEAEFLSNAPFITICQDCRDSIQEKVNDYDHNQKIGSDEDSATAVISETLVSTTPSSKTVTSSESTPSTEVTNSSSESTSSNDAASSSGVTISSELTSTSKSMTSCLTSKDQQSDSSGSAGKKK